MRRPLVLLTVVLIALGLVACGSDDSGSDTSSAGTPSSSATVDSGNDTGTQTEAANPKDTSVKPVIEKPAGSPPRRLVKEDIVKGKGPAAKKGDSVTMQYVGVSFSNGEQFDASWDPPASAPFGPFQLGTGQVIPGWDKGIVGMRKGGRRKLVIPPELAYGSAGQGPIAPNETLIFVVDLVSIG
jgi:peptidylprolyl isomerase